MLCLLMCSAAETNVSAAATDSCDKLVTAEVAAENKDAKPVNFYQTIAKENFKTLNDVDFRRECEADYEIYQKQGYDAYLKATFKRLLNPNPNIRRQSMFNLLVRFEDKNPFTQTDVLDFKTWSDLELLCGPKSDVKLYLASRLDRTVTEAGRVSFYRKLVSPESDIKKLENQQAITSYLLKNEACFNEIDEKLKALVVSENLMLSFWYAEFFNNWECERGKARLPFSSMKIPFTSQVSYIKRFEAWINKSFPIAHIKKLEDWVNKYPALIRSVKVQTKAFQYMTYALMLYWFVAFPMHTIKGVDVKDHLKKIIPDWINNRLPDSKDLSTLNVFTMLSGLGVLMWLVSKSCDGNPRLDRGIKGGIEVSNKAWELCWTISDLLEFKRDDKHFYKKVVYVAKYINNLKAVAQVISKNHELISRMPSIITFNEYLDKLEKSSKDMNYLFDLLEKETFNGEYSSLNIYRERVEVAFRLIAELKDKFVDAMITLGEIDAQMSIARLCKEFKDKRVTFCQPIYIDPTQVDTPSVKLIDFWNPFIDSEKVVPSSLTAGQLFGQPQNIIITGPNASGKSTITKAFIMSAIMAQSLGIASAKEMTFTPFHKIITYLNITDDIAAGNSHFKAGVMRARDVNQTFKSLEPHKFGLAAVDEVFNGTTPAEGRAAAYSLINLLGLQPLGMCITNTHFQIITSLEQLTGRFANYKVSVVDIPGEKIQYPFQLERGISDQNVAFKILKEEGFGDDFLNQAQQVLDGSVEIGLTA